MSTCQFGSITFSSCSYFFNICHQTFGFIWYIYIIGLAIFLVGEVLITFCTLLLSMTKLSTAISPCPDVNRYNTWLQWHDQTKSIVSSLIFLLLIIILISSLLCCCYHHQYVQDCNLDFRFLEIRNHPVHPVWLIGLSLLNFKTHLLSEINW